MALRCLVELGFETTAVVTMADDGGSSGALRREHGLLPPGDARNCLVALSEDPDSVMARAFQYRFSNGDGLAGHVLGNLLIAALTDLEGGFPQALEAAGRLLGVAGRVVPSTLQDVVLHAEDVAGRPVRGQANVARSHAPVARVWLEPGSPQAFPAALEAIAQADAVVVGPGSLFTSVIPNFLVAGTADAMRSASAVRVYVCNVANQRGETGGMDAADHVDVLVAHGLADAIDVVIVNALGSGSMESSSEGSADASEGSSARDRHASDARAGVEAVRFDSATADRIASTGWRTLLADVVDPDDPCKHSPGKLCSVLEEVL